MSYIQAAIRTLSEQNTKTIPQPPGPGDLLPIEFVWIFIGRSGGIRTHDPYTPSIVRYQAALRSVRDCYSVSHGPMQSAFRPTHI